MAHQQSRIGEKGVAPSSPTSVNLHHLDIEAGPAIQLSCGVVNLVTFDVVWRPLDLAAL
jgi:hypothetical protein